MAIDLTSCRALIFDLFHTLTSVESSHAPGKRTKDILGVTEKEWNDQLLLYSKDRLRGMIKDPYEIIRRMAHAIDPHIPEERIKVAVENRLARFRHTLRYIEPTVLVTLAKLRDDGKLLGLVSNGDAGEIAGWKESPLRPFFNSVIFSCEVGYVKPEREIYEMCMRELAVTAAESVFIGDGGSDELKGAWKIGMRTVLITGVINLMWPEKVRSARPYADHEIEKIADLFLEKGKET